MSWGSPCTTGGSQLGVITFPTASVAWRGQSCLPCRWAGSQDIETQRDKPSFRLHQSAHIGPSPVEGTAEAGCITLVEPPWGEEIFHLLRGSKIFLSYRMFSVARHRRLCMARPLDTGQRTENTRILSFGRVPKPSLSALLQV